MNLIQNNPFRVTGLLVGATAREQERQIKRLRQYIEAEQEPDDDFSFPVLGELDRSLDNLNDAASKLNLDSDKMGAALFWFYNGNSIIDEPAFEELKDGNISKAEAIWKKLTYNSEGEILEVTKRNASAFQNLSTLFLNQFSIDEETLQLKLLLLESDFFIDLKNKATDGTYNISKKELQILFLNSLLQDESVEMSEFIDAISKIEFLAKEDFLKSFVQKPIEEIEKQIENAKNQRKSNTAEGVKIGNLLFNNTFKKLKEIETILGETNLKYTNIADKVANEILQCSIDYFNDSQENDSNTDYVETAMKLAKKAESLAVGKLTKDRVTENLKTLEEIKDRELSQAINVLQSIKAAYEEACRQIDKQVDELQYRTLGNTKIPKINVSINWLKVEEMKWNCLAWDKVAELILEAIPLRNIEKIKHTSNATKIDEYKSLVNFILSIISYSYKNKIAYINYWETPITPSTSARSKTKSNSSSSNSQSNFEFAPNAWWIIGLIGFFVAISFGGIGGAMVFSVIAAAIGYLVNKN
jgi:hypothetical protein